MNDLTHDPQSDHCLNTATDDTIPPAAEDWVHIKPVPPSISNIQQVIPEWVPTQPDEPQTTTNEQGPLQLPTEEEGTPSALHSDRVSGEATALHSDSVSGEASAPQSDSVSGEASAPQSDCLSGEVSAPQSDSVSGEASAPQSDSNQLVSGDSEDGIPSAPQSADDNLGTDVSEVPRARETERESGGNQEATVSGEQAVASVAKLTWDSLGGAKKRFNYDILPKVCSKILKALDGEGL